METSPVLKYTIRFKETLRKIVIDNCVDGVTSHILDLGCGKGVDLERLSYIAKDKLIYGIDSSLKELREAALNTQAIKNCYLLQAKGENIPFRSGAFDVVVSAEVIEHTDQLRSFIGEVFRVLKPGGVFAATTPSKFNYVSIVGNIVPRFAKKFLRKFVYHIDPGEDVNPHFREYTPKELKKIFQESGFLVENITYGALRVPAWRLFEKMPVLFFFWKIIDGLIGRIPYLRDLKANFIITARKPIKADSKILIVNLGGIGDMLLSLPSLKALKNSYPDSKISMLVSPKIYTFVKGLSYVNEVFMFDLEYGGIMFLDKAVLNLLTLITLRKKKFDLAVNMRTLVSEKSAKKIKLMLDIIRPAFTAGRDTAGRGYFLDIKVPETDIGEKYEMEYDIDTVGALGVKVLDKNIDLSFEGAVIKQVEKKLASENICPSDVLIGVHPGGMPSRRWKINNFAQVIKSIDNQVKCRFVVTGGADECQLALDLSRISGVEIVNMAGLLTLEELGALIKRCNVYISNDTGPMHIAAVLKTPLVAILGPGDLTRFDPRNISENAAVMYKKIDCSPCNKKECDSMKCLSSIYPEEVIGAVLRFIREK